MSADLDTNADGTVAAMFSAREIPWHTMGTITDDCLTAEAAMVAAHLDYDVLKYPLTATTPDGVKVDVVGQFATGRTNPFDPRITDIFGVVGSKYSVVQNIQNAEFLNEFVGQSGAHFETAGALDNGRKTFVSMKAPEAMLIGGRDAVDLYLVASNEHTGRSPFRIDATPIRPVCTNTLRLGWASAVGTVKIRHTGNVVDKAAEAARAMGVMWDYARYFEAEANALVSQKMTDKAFRALVDTVVFPIPDDEADRAKANREERAADVFDLWKNAETQADIRGTKWAAYNAVAEWADWKMPIRDEAARAQRIVDDPLLDRIKDKVLVALR